MILMHVILNKKYFIGGGLQKFIFPAKMYTLYWQKSQNVNFSTSFLAEYSQSSPIEKTILESSALKFLSVL